MLKCNFMIIMVIFLFLGAAYPGPGYGEPDFVVRPYLGYGNSRSSDALLDGSIQHYGVRLLLSTEGNKRYGLEVTKFHFDDDNKTSDFYSTGIVLEQTFWQGFKMSIGALGYFDYGADKANPFGAVLMLGWEPKEASMFKPFIVLRNDYIFYTNTNIINSLSAGVTMEF